MTYHSLSLPPSAAYRPYRLSFPLRDAGDGAKTMLKYTQKHQISDMHRLHGDDRSEFGRCETSKIKMTFSRFRPRWGWGAFSQWQ